MIFLIECNTKLDIVGCTESSKIEDVYGCENVYDRNDSSNWSTQWGAKPEWLNLSLAGVFNIRQLRVKQGLNANNRFKDIILEFQNNMKIERQLKNTKNWTDVILKHTIESSYVKLEGSNHHGMDKGVKMIYELQVFGCNKGNR